MAVAGKALAVCCGGRDRHLEAIGEDAALLGKREVVWRQLNGERDRRVGSRALERPGATDIRIPDTGKGLDSTSAAAALIGSLLDGFTSGARPRGAM